MVSWCKDLDEIESTAYSLQSTHSYLVHPILSTSFEKIFYDFNGFTILPRENCGIAAHSVDTCIGTIGHRTGDMFYRSTVNIF